MTAVIGWFWVGTLVSPVSTYPTPRNHFICSSIHFSDRSCYIVSRSDNLKARPKHPLRHPRLPDYPCGAVCPSHKPIRPLHHIHHIM
ncbi:hypothetical protein F5B22DRAFT_618980 [Xylaria bambusicola]|uniref:uncharacterized protein n=1 Tax=Xylaria bambusicola TaxID=326684 RepID=UPI0020074036|nr:uncharacterized protein F5B22DRAFT_618980 [Xylaria bambusicola]KAI0508856.1 hypothetical protein F5B22DRAFT_618980 [Xylaria bambusicola]